MAKCALWMEEGKCELADDKPSAPGHSILGSLDGDIEISNAVGIASPNHFNDVFKIQYALNRIPPIDGGPNPRLEIDGQCGPKTIKAIQNFQLKHFGWKGADGKVEPNKQTIKKLNEIGKKYGAHPVLPLDHVTDAWLLAAMLQHLPYARECVRASKENLIRAIISLEMGSDTAASAAIQEQRLALSKRHFKIDKFPSPKTILTRLHERYARMEIILNNPQVYFALDTDDSGAKIKSYYAQARIGGYFMEDTQRRIEFRRGAFFASGNREFTTHILIHEMAHFTEDSDEHGHYSFGWVDGPKMKQLLPSQCIVNAHSFANFSLEARNGIMSKPSWMRS